MEDNSGVREHGHDDEPPHSNELANSEHLKHDEREGKAEGDDMKSETKDETLSIEGARLDAGEHKSKAGVYTHGASLAIASAAAAAGAGGTKAGKTYERGTVVWALIENYIDKEGEPRSNFYWPCIVLGLDESLMEEGEQAHPKYEVLLLHIDGECVKFHSPKVRPFNVDQMITQMPTTYPVYKYNESFMDEARSEAKQIVIKQKRKTLFDVEDMIKRLMGPAPGEKVTAVKSSAARKIDFHKEARETEKVVGPNAAGQGNGKLPIAPSDPLPSADLDDDLTESARDDDDLYVASHPQSKSPAAKPGTKKGAAPSSSKKRSRSGKESSDDDEAEKIPDKPKKQLGKAISPKQRSNKWEEIGDEDVSSDEEPRSEGDFNDDVCYKCHYGGTLTCCDGGCFRSWHSDCLPPGAVSENKEFCCNECFTEDWQCWYCQRKLTLKAWKQCDEDGCGRKYHLDCAFNLPLTKVIDRNEGVYICPRHVCGMCDKKLGWTNKCTRCVLCPISYHRKCLPLGAYLLEAKTQLLCARHDEECSKLAARKGRNFEFCVACKLPMPDNVSNEGPCVDENDAVDWIRCSGCLNAYHCKCLPANLFRLKKALLNQSWYCGDCVSGKMPRSGDYVWAKAPGYPYWPAKVSDAPPAKLLKINHDEIDIAVRWYGKKPYEFSWMKNPLLGKFVNLNKDTIKDLSVKLSTAFRQIEGALAGDSDDDAAVRKSNSVKEKARKARKVEGSTKKSTPKKEKSKAPKSLLGDVEDDSDVQVVSVIKSPSSKGKEPKGSKTKDSTDGKKRKAGPMITKTEIPARMGKTVIPDVRRSKLALSSKVANSPTKAKTVTPDVTRIASATKYVGETSRTPAKHIEEPENTESEEAGAMVATEDFCFLCGRGGRLYMCDYPNCPKVYHKECLENDGERVDDNAAIFYCRRHVCVCCSIATSKYMCTRCPNGYCKAHVDDEVKNSNPLLCVECLAKAGRLPKTKGKEKHRK